MQRGKNTVVETGHIVILGTSARLPVLIEQLAIADRARRDNVIVVLANREQGFGEAWRPMRPGFR